MNTAPPSTTPAGPPPLTAAQGAAFALVVLTGMNLLNYIDRYVPSAVKDLIKRDLNLTDAETSLPLSAFIVVYMVTSPVFGMLADKGNRRLLIALGVAIWSVATAGAAFAQGFWTLLAARALVGVGEAAYAVISPSLLSDFFAPSRRNRIFTLFYVATPVGAALGFLIGGLLGESLGWRAAFLVCGLPGLLVAALALLLKDPVRGQFDEEPPGGKPPAPSWPQALRSLATNKRYLFTVAGYTAVTFAVGGIADWFPTYLSRVRGLGLAEAGTQTGAITVVGGIVGTVLGGLLADRLRGRVKQPYLFTSAVSMVPALLFAVLALYVVESTAATFACILVCQIFLWFYNGPVNALLVNSVDAGLRARAFSLSILSIHLFGDALSPPLIGFISDATGNLPLAIAVVPAALGVGCLIWLVGWRVLPPAADDLPPT